MKLPDQEASQTLYWTLPDEDSVPHVARSRRQRGNQETRLAKTRRQPWRPPPWRSTLDTRVGLVQAFGEWLSASPTVPSMREVRESPSREPSRSGDGGGRGAHGRGTAQPRCYRQRPTADRHNSDGPCSVVLDLSPGPIRRAVGAWRRRPPHTPRGTQSGCSLGTGRPDGPHAP